MKPRIALSGIFIFILMFHHAGCEKRPVEFAPAAMSADEFLSDYEAVTTGLESLVGNLRLHVPGAHLFGLLGMRHNGEFKVDIQCYSLPGSIGFELIASGPSFQLFLPSERKLYYNDAGVMTGTPDMVSGMEQLSEDIFPVKAMLDGLPLVMGRVRREGMDYEWIPGRDGEGIIELDPSGRPARRLWFRSRPLALERVEILKDDEVMVETTLERGTLSRFESFGWTPRKMEIKYQNDVYKIFIDDVRFNPDPAPDISFREAPGFKTVLIQDI